jgi:hypothetical protein
VGWPGGKNIRRVVGQCWYPEVATDKHAHIFVSPAHTETQEIAKTVLHEMCHAVVGPGHGHKGTFVKVAQSVGLQAPWTSTLSSDELRARFERILDAMNPYPHGSIKVGAEQQGPNLGPKQSTRLRKATSPDCGYTIRVTAKWIEQGLPTCPCGIEMEEA